MTSRKPLLSLMSIKGSLISPVFLFSFYTISPVCLPECKVFIYYIYFHALERVVNEGID